MQCEVMVLVVDHRQDDCIAVRAFERGPDRGWRGDVIVGADQDPDRRRDRGQVVIDAVIDHHPLQRPGIGRPGVQGAVDGDPGRDIAQDQRCARRGERAKDTHRFAEHVGGRVPVGGEAGERAELADLAAGGIGVAVGGWGDQDESGDQIGVTGGEVQGDGRTGGVGDDDAAGRHERSEGVGVAVDVVAGAAGLGGATEAQESTTGGPDPEVLVWSGP